MVRKSVFSLVSIKQKVVTDIRTQRCVLVTGVVGVEVGCGGGGGANGGGGGSVARVNACPDE